MFAIAHDGFVQTARYATLAEAIVAWKRDIQSRFLYQYDCSICEVDSEGKILRIVDFAELTN
jgi:hypothetical protein